MRNQKKLISLAAALLLVGAGCSASPATNEPANAPTDSAQETPVAAPSDTREIVAPTAIDSTWQTYTNKALNFEFKTPTKGRNAPRWEVTFVAENDAKIKDGCVAIAGGSSEKTTVGGTAFCHSMSAPGATATDHFATKNGPRYVVVTFTKTPPAGVTDFSWDEYRAQLDQIMSTFAYTK